MLGLEYIWLAPGFVKESARCLRGLGRQRHYPYETSRADDGSSDRSFSTMQMTSRLFWIITTEPER